MEPVVSASAAQPVVTVLDVENVITRQPINGVVLIVPFKSERHFH
jgi:hypothetical protein